MSKTFAEDKEIIVRGKNGHSFIEEFMSRSSSRWM